MKVNLGGKNSFDKTSHEFGDYFHYTLLDPWVPVTTRNKLENISIQ
ncbi:hypothetical protein GLW08_10570 [Pontibacillus yanchengensis]|uniref:Uncharacterized protein n=1 Tax=Pontibacillus yanchengensis TaxID=462910 RepID=A0ACC7VGG9_9BACI|nr:hypothetical protein [Pontibacillus yanchengensis]MYL53780.1 hypothetical protein [Pontibacillus yanchengensis]